MADVSGFERFGSLVNAQAMADIMRWRGDAELGRLVARLEAFADSEKFLNAWAEAFLARHLLRSGCEIRFEVPTPAGRSADFEVAVDDQRFFLHVKRLATDRPSQRKLTFSSRLRYLERIKRPYVVNVSWNEGLSDRQMQHFVKEAAAFISQARVGDELAVKDGEHGEIGGCRIVAPWEGEHVTLAIGLPSGSMDEAPRMQRLLRRAHRQFMPKAVNVILVASSLVEDVADFERALLGSHIERWDAPPPPGRRIAHGRATDGFWSGGHIADSHAAGWFRLAPEAPDFAGRLYVRRDGALPQPAREILLRLFDTAPRTAKEQPNGRAADASTTKGE